MHGVLYELVLSLLFLGSHSVPPQLGLQVSLLPIKFLLLSLDLCEAALLTSLEELRFSPVCGKKVLLHLPSLSFFHPPQFFLTPALILELPLYLLVTIQLGCPGKICALLACFGGFLDNIRDILWINRSFRGLSEG